MPKKRKKENISLKVEPVDIDESKLNEIDHGIWKFPSLHLMIGHIASGKSTLLNNIITKFWNPIFEDRVILFSPTARNDPIMNQLIENDEIFIHFDSFDMNTMDAVLESIEEDSDPTTRYLVIIDDAMGSIPSTMSKEGRRFNKYLANFRHIPTEGKISIIIAIQKFSALNNVVRSNAHYLYLLGRVSEKELNSYSEEMNAITGGDSKKFIELYKKSKGGSKYNFLLLDFKKMRLLQNFDTVLYDEETTINNDDNEDEDNEKKIIGIENET